MSINTQCFQHRCIWNECINAVMKHMDRWIHVIPHGFLCFIWFSGGNWLSIPVWNMESGGRGYSANKVSPLDTNMESMIIYETSWIDAIVQDDVEKARHLLDSDENIGSTGLTHVVGKRRKTGNYTLLPHTFIKCKLACSTYAPDNIWCLAAIYNSRKVLQFLVEQQVNATGQTSHGNTYLHCLIAFASMASEEVELQAVDSAKYIQSLLSENDYKQILMAENEKGLRPLEFASHFGMFALFTSIFDSRPFYVARSMDHSFYTIQYYDITEYIMGNRFSKSPPYTMMFLEEKSLKHSKMRDVFLADPMKTWFSALLYSNIPIIIAWCVLRMTFIGSFLKVLFLSAASAGNGEIGPVTDVLQNQSNITLQMTKNSTDNGDINESLEYLLLYTSIFSFCTLSYDTVTSCVALFKSNRWLFETINGKKCTISKARFYEVTHHLTLSMVLVLGIVILLQNSTPQIEERVYFYLHTASLTVIFAGVWSILFFFQLVPKINIYIFAIQNMLGKFMCFSFVLIFFFLAFSSVFYILAIDYCYGQTIYKTFELMLNIVNFKMDDSILRILHVTFIFVMVFILLNIVIAIFTSAYNDVIQNGDVISKVQMLSIAGITEPVMTTLFPRLHNWLCKDYLVFEGKHVYVTKVVMKPTRLPITGNGSL